MQLPVSQSNPFEQAPPLATAPHTPLTQFLDLQFSLLEQAPPNARLDPSLHYLL